MNPYNRYYRSLMKGPTASPRGLQVHYRTDVSYGFFPGTAVRRPHDNPAIGFIEGLQFIAGYFDPRQIARVAPNARLDLFTGQSAYGPRTAGQFEKVIDELSKDPASRRAVVMVAHPEDDLDQRPCTLSLQFQVLDGMLHTTVAMRSSDAVWGLPYDQIQFGMVAIAVASCLRLPPVIVLVNIANAHVYDRTALGQNERFFDDPDHWEYDLPELASWQDYVAWARSTADFCENREMLLTQVHFRPVKSQIAVPS